jgi:hypothetical protein
VGLVVFAFVVVVEGPREGGDVVVIPPPGVGG